MVTTSAVAVGGVSSDRMLVVAPSDSAADPWVSGRLIRGEILVLKGGLEALPPEAEADRRAESQ